MNLRRLLLAVWLFVACVPSPKELAAQASADTKSLIQEAIETGQATNSWQSIDKLYKSTTGSTSSSRPQVPETSSTTSLTDLLAQYSDRIFADSNVVDRPVGALIFGLSGKLLCTDPSSSTSVPAPSCVDQFDKLQLRLKVTSGPDLTVQVGPDHLEPVVLKLRAKQSISLEEDLGQTEKAWAFAINALGSSASLGTLVASGRVEIKLLRNGDHDFTLSYSNLAPIAIAYTANGYERSWTSEARSPVASLRVEGPARQATLTFDEGRMEGHGISTDFISQVATPAPDGGTTYTSAAAAPVSFVLAGLSAQLTVAEGKDPSLTHIGLGGEQSSVTWGSKKLVSIDLNASMGRSFAVSVPSVGAGLRFDATPGIEAVVYLGLSALPQGVQVDSHFLDTTYTGLFKAANGPASLEYQPASSSQKTSFRVAAGTLTLSSSAAGSAPRTFVTGNCLGSASSSSSSADPVLEALTTVSCP